MIKLLVHNNKGEYELLDTHETEVDEILFVKGEHFNHAETDHHAYHFDKKFDYAELVELGVYCNSPLWGWYRLEDATPKEPEGTIVHRDLDAVFVIAYSFMEAKRFWEASEVTRYQKRGNEWVSKGPIDVPEGSIIMDGNGFSVAARTPEHAELIWRNQ